MIAPQELLLGQTVTLEGYADDFGTDIIAVEFSFDDGNTWTRHETPDAAAERSVHWTYSFTPNQRGEHRLKIRSINSRGEHSPQAAAAIFYVV